MSDGDNDPSLLQTLRNEPILTVIGIVFWAAVGWWMWSTLTYRDVAEADRQYCYLIAGAASQAAEARDSLVDERSFKSQFRRDMAVTLPEEVLGVIELAYQNTLMSPSELRDHVEGQCLRRFRQDNED